MSRQLIGSILVALAIVAVTIVVVTASSARAPRSATTTAAGIRTEQREDNSGKGSDED